MIRLDGITAGYGSRVIQQDLTAEIKKGEIVSLIGPNGGGKSTLLRTMEGQLKALGGTVFIDDNAIHDIRLNELARKMAVVTTERVRPQLMSCRDVVAAGRLPYTDGFTGLRSEDEAAIERAMSLMKIMEMAGQPYTSLSDGQKQRTLIARAICQETDYLMMDEPTSYLDIRYQMELTDVLKVLSSEGITIVMSIHELEHAFAVSDRLILVYDNGTTLIRTCEEVRKEEALKELFALDDEMYERVKRRLI